MTALLVAVLSGVLFALSLPPLNWEGLGWFALAPLLIGAQKRRPLEAVGLGMLAGITSGIVQAGWSQDTQRLFWAYIPFLWLTFLFGGVALAASRLPMKDGSLRWVAFIACAGVGGEWLTSSLPLPLNIALCQYKFLPLIQIASLVGIWGVSFLLWWTNAALAEAFLQKRWRTRPVGIAVGLIALSLGYGFWQLRPAADSQTALRGAAIQDLTREEIGDLAPASKDAADREERTRQAAAQGAQMIVWSEESLGNEFAPNDPKDPTRLLARKLHTALVVGYSDDARPKAYNCAALIDSQGIVQGIHHKIHLYPGENQTIQAGRGDRAFPTPLGMVGLVVCFDTCYTDVTRRLVRSGAQIIAMPNYDPPTPRGVLHRLHGAMLPFRAVENAVPFVRADSNGLSQIIDAQGRIAAQSPLYAPDTLIGTVSLGDGQGTLFTRQGDWLAYFCLLGLITGIATAIQQRRRL